MARSKKTKSTATPRISPFKTAVGNCDEIKDELKSGLSALKSDSKFVKTANPKLIEGSVDIDGAVKKLYPEDARWDYVVGYNDEAVFIEVHPAATSNVSEMVSKVKWLKSWLDSKAQDLRELNKSKVYYWIPSGGVSILKGSAQYKQIAANHLKIKRVVDL